MRDVLAGQAAHGAVGSSALLGAPLLSAGAVGSRVVSQRGATAGLVSWPCPLSWNAFCLGNAFRLGMPFVLKVPVCLWHLTPGFRRRQEPERRRSGGCWRSPASPCSAPLRPRLLACRPSLAPWRHLLRDTPGHAGDAPGRVAMAGAAAPPPAHGGDHTQGSAAQRPGPPHHLRTREGHERRAPDFRPRPLTDCPLPRAMPCWLLTPGRTLPTGRGESRPPGGCLAGLRQRQPVGPSLEGATAARTRPGRHPGLPQTWATPGRPCDAGARCPNPGAARSACPWSRARGTGASRHRTTRTGHGAGVCGAAAHPTTAIRATVLGGGTRPQTRRWDDSPPPRTPAVDARAPACPRLPHRSRRAEPNARLQAPLEAGAT